MKCKRVLSLLLLSACVITASNGLFTMSANAETKNSVVVEKTVEKSNINDTNKKNGPYRIAGMVTVTAKSGANIRTGAGANYSKIPPAASYGEDLDYNGKSKTGTDGVKWYQVIWNGEVGWISSSVSRLG